MKWRSEGTEKENEGAKEVKPKGERRKPYKRKAGEAWKRGKCITKTRKPVKKKTGSKLWKNKK